MAALSTDTDGGVKTFSQHIRFLPLGDSYTICEGATREESWPYLLTQRLNQGHIYIQLLDNPAVTGYTTLDLIEKELPLFDELQPDIVTLLIGVNDYVQGTNTAQFDERLIFILDHLRQKGPSHCKVILLTIPDFSVTPNGYLYAHGRNVREGIEAFNDLIKGEGKKRSLPVIDLFKSALDMEHDPSLIAEDGLHPSAKEYANWEKLISPVFLGALNDQS